MVRTLRLFSSAALLAALAAAASGCLMAGNYHSAKTLEKGTSQVGLTFSVTNYEFTRQLRDNEGQPTGQTEVESVSLPNVIPELSYHIGMSDNVEVGGRVAVGSLGLEGDVKFRFLQADKLHLAIAPAIGYQAFLVVQGGSLKLPGILTYELADNFDVTAAVFGSTTKYSSVDDDSSGDFGVFNGTLAATGVAFGVDLHTETFNIRPAVEFTRYVADFDDGDDFDAFNTVNVLVHIAWTGGKEKKQLNRIEDKLDQLTAPPPPYAPAPGPPAGPVEPPPPPQ